MPVSEVAVCASDPGSSQFTQVTLLPRLMVTCSGMNVKFRTRTTTVPAAAFGTLQSPVKGSGPAVVFSEKQLASDALPIATMTIAESAAFLRDPERAQLNIFYRQRG